MSEVLRIARKEFAGFFSSPIAFIFLGTFLAVTLFIFFWVDTFFARNIADVRPLFAWMPLLLIFLVAAVTMRSWSEERRAGTLEFLLTSPVSSVHLVLGKFLSCLALVAVALILTLPLPITVSFIGSLDWGPVFGGYVAGLFLAAAYVSIGLFVSSRSENQIISLILTVVVCGLLYLLGASPLIGLVGNDAAAVLKLLGSGSRFASITRGVIDLRDLYYYVSLVGLFLTLNVFVLEWLRWAGNARNAAHRRWAVITTLVAANFLAANFWLTPITAARADMTRGHIYSISDATRNYLAQLKEPLLIRGYFSAKTHPLLAPLEPQLRDLLAEYAIAGHGKVRVEFIDPAEHPDLQREAGQKYGIRPVAFKVNSKYQASVVSSYFNLLIKYGDQYQTLGFRDLIDVKLRGPRNVEVGLRNPEYDITQAIKKVLYAYRASGQLFANIPHPVTFHGYFSADRVLPPELVKVKRTLNVVLDKLKKQGGDKFRVQLQDPAANGGVLAKQLESKQGLRPLTAGLFNPQKFWFYMTLESNGRRVPIPLPHDFGKAKLEKNINAALKHFSTGYLKTIALYTPPAAENIPHMGRVARGPRFALLRKTLQDEYSIDSTDLKSGRVPDDADLLLVAAPTSLNKKQLFAVDQFLMQGGTVILATSPYAVHVGAQLQAHQQESGLADWLKHNGIDIQSKLVMDPRNAALPVPVERRLGGFVVRETRMVDYPYFADIRGDGINSDSGLTAGIDQLTMSWASPIHIDKQQNKNRKVTPLLRTSPQSWTSTSVDVEPDFAGQGASGFATKSPEGRQLVGVMLQGGFTSYFKGKPSPLEAKDDNKKSGQSKKAAAGKGHDAAVMGRVIDKSPDSARIILFSSNAFLSDGVLRIASIGLGTRYLKPVNLVANAVDWSLQDRGLLAIRGRAHFARTLVPLSRNGQRFWEYLNYGLALLGLLVVWLIRRLSDARARRRYQAVLGTP